MKYFLSNEVKTACADKCHGEWLDDIPQEKVGIQVAKNSYSTGRDISRMLLQHKIESHILADSDRCCIDWVAVQHAQVKCIIKRSFSCPLLNLSRSKKITDSYKVIQYITECNISVDLDASSLTTDTPYFPPECEIYLAIDVKYIHAYEKIQEYLGRVLGREVKEWKYSQAEERSIIIVLSEDRGFIDYFVDNYSCILIEEKLLTQRLELLKKIKEDAKTLEVRKTRALVAKMANIDILKSASKIGIVFTSGDHMDLIDLVSKYLDMNNKKFYHFYINGLKPNKLGNFVGVDAFIVIQCPFSSFRFEENIIALRPFDLLMAFREEWDGRYSTNLEVAKHGISEEIKKKTETQTASETGSTSLLQITSTMNALRLSKDEVCTAEQAKKYFQTGEYLKKVSGITIESTVEEANDDLIEGYSGIPTEYKKGNMP
ncbi:uncharacterized protein NESG_01502 [Nematocida ausubeli]|uniref:2-(3-amino-3-carboxypropyl)histidine synthase subunit 1 n=1 Tax=Nematocida ausubeli (strain ATCC PRA-371 / ERTm2) TaxID=1913371 RepID=A0A086J2L2_NEMA1|nr:uncharacterized protein NESG_01502 [Nematocida ausubeli]KFG26380.1 hypothetical protein NESG_01502 [Nematocida ausubeli]